MKYKHFTAHDGASIQASSFDSRGGASETHLYILPAAKPTFEEQLISLQTMYLAAQNELELRPLSAVFRRLFLSDIANQNQAVYRSALAEDNAGGPVALSLVQQPPLSGSKVALWAYHLKGGEELLKEQTDCSVALYRGDLTHLFTTLPGGDNNPGTPSDQTRDIFERYVRILASYNSSLAENLIRTWVFVHDIDRNYQGMVGARRELFAKHGMTSATHFVSSTGIEGSGADPHCSVLLDAYAIAGLEGDQVRYLTAPERLGPTSAYGVTFERGTRIDYADRSHVFISGTASIDPSGKTIHVGDLPLQTERTFSNMMALLYDAGAVKADIAQMLVYLRDPTDLRYAAGFVEQYYPQIPVILLHAPVCRPDWLIEVECLAIKPNDDDRWQNY